MTGDVCEFECAFGFTAQGTHRCGLQAFEGGFCAPNDCIEGFEILNSPTQCTGYLGDECQYTCDAGYTVAGSHVCGVNRAFTGGFCSPNACHNGSSIALSSTTCLTRTTDTCSYACESGYFAAGAHVCGADTVLRGGQCLASSCTGGTSLLNSPTICTVSEAVAWALSMACSLSQGFGGRWIRGPLARTACTRVTQAMWPASLTSACGTAAFRAANVCRDAASAARCYRDLRQCAMGRMGTPATSRVPMAALPRERTNVRATGHFQVGVAVRISAPPACQLRTLLTDLLP
jgi:hypothetical protein